MSQSQPFQQNMDYDYQLQMQQQQDYYNWMMMQSQIPPPPEGPYPGVTHEEFNKFGINEQRLFQGFLREVAQYYSKQVPNYQKLMEEFLTKNTLHVMTPEEHQLMDYYLQMKAQEAQMKLAETQQIQQQEKLIQVEPVKPIEVKPVEAVKPVVVADPTAPKPKKKLNISSKAFDVEIAKAPALPKFPKHPPFLDIDRFQENFGMFMNYYQPQATEEYMKYPTPEEEKKRMDKEEERRKRKEDEIKRALEKRERATQNADKPKATAIVEKKVELDNLEIDLTVFVDPDETRQAVNLVFIGHVDAGKSTLCGRLLLDLGEVSETDVKKFEQEATLNNRESWWLAYVMDQNEEERQKGKTVECGKAIFSTKNKRFSLADAPGHKNYVPNMIMGACQADLAGLIISAKMGEFESGFEKGGQTQEHALLAKSLGVEHVIIIVTKMDTIEWKKERFDMIVNAITDFTSKHCQFQKVYIIPIDALGGSNISKPVDPAICNWYNGPPLLQLIDEIPIPKANEDGPIRIPVLDRFKDLGSLYIYGKLESGKIVDGLEVSLYPKKGSMQITGIYNHKDQRLKYAKAGENIKLKVKGIEDEEIKRGYMVCNLQTNPCMVSQEFQAKVRLLDLPETRRIFSCGYQCIMHLHAAVEEIEVQMVEAIFEPETNKLIKQNFMKSMSEGIVKFTVKNPVCLEKYDTISSLGRFALRDDGKTIGFGEVQKIKPYKPQ